MTKQQSQAALEVCERATKGPWRGAADESEGGQWWGTFPSAAPECLVLSCEPVEDGDFPNPICCTNDDGLSTEQEYQDAKFIALTRDPVMGYEAVLRENLRLMEWRRQQHHTCGLCAVPALQDICDEQEFLAAYFGAPAQEKENAK